MSASCTCVRAQSCLILCNPMDRQTPLSMGFPKQEYWNGLPFPPPKDLPDPGMEFLSPALQADSLLLSQWGIQLHSITYAYVYNFDKQAKNKKGREESMDSATRLPGFIPEYCLY